MEGGRRKAGRPEVGRKEGGLPEFRRQRDLGLPAHGRFAADLGGFEVQNIQAVGGRRRAMENVWANRKRR